MATRDTPFAPGTPCWVDLMSSDPAASTSFYGELFGWTADTAAPEFGGYVTFRSDGHQVAGLAPKTPEMGAHPDAWSTYISTADIEASVKAAEAAGGTILTSPMPVGDLGSMALVQDAAGAAFGLWQPGSHTGFGKYNEAGSVSWDELHSRDFKSASAFYADVFGWTMNQMSDTDEFRYATGQVDGEDVAGMMDSSSFLPEGVPSHWAVYFGVEDTDQALARATELGGHVLRPAQDTPFGRLADAMDPTGAMFKLHSTKLANPAPE